MNKITRTLGFIFTHPLSQKHPAKSIWRFLIWQMQSSFSPGKFIVKPFVGPVKFYARKGLTGITGNIYTGLHEFTDMGFLLHFLKPGDTFFDIGANVGSYTLLAAGISKAKTVTVEPIQATFSILSNNITLNNLADKVTLLNAGAGAQKGEIVFSINEDTTNHVIAADETTASGTITVPVITVDSLLTNGSPQLIKMDVEGYETEVLKGMKETLALDSLKAIIIELNGSGGRYGFNEDDIHALLLSNQFMPYSYDPFKRVLTEQPSYGTSNTIYCRDLAFINARLKQATGISIMGQTI